MGKGKGSFDHWAARVAVNQILFEVRGELHEAVVKDAFRLAGNKLPGKTPQEEQAWCSSTNPMM
jgi:ribosomal protein L16/L10AE